MTLQHKQLASGRWQQLPLVGQLANIGSEIGRAINWRVKDKPTAQLAAVRAHELIWLTVEDPKNKSRLKEITRLREVFNDYFYGSNQYHSQPKDFESYFLALTMYYKNHSYATS